MTYDVIEKNMPETAINHDTGFVFYEVDTNITGKLTTSTDDAISSTLDAIIAQRIDWENNEYARSNAKLYCILTECYEVFQNMNGLDDESRVCQSAFKRVCTAKGYTFNDSTHLTAKVVQFVFGVEDRRRISSYSKVLRTAQENNITPSGLSDFIVRNRGIDEIRRGKVDVSDDKNKSSPKKSKMSAETQGRAATYEPVIGTVSSETISQKFDASNYIHSVLFLATTEDGISFDIRRVIQEHSVIKSAYVQLSKSVSEANIRKMVIDDAKNQSDDEPEDTD